jgi:hypothetical protein
MAKYEIVKNEFLADRLTRTDNDGKIWWIPLDPANSDYQAYLVSLEADQETPTAII